MLTLKNTEGHSQAVLDRCNRIAAGILTDNPDLSPVRAHSAVLGSYDPELSDADIEHWALSELGVL